MLNRWLLLFKVRGMIQINFFNDNLQVGIIGGSGLDDPHNQILNCQTITSREEAKNDFGLPSSNLYHGSINDVDVILLSR